MTLQDQTHAPWAAGEEPATPVDYRTQRFLDEQNQHKLDALNEGMVAEFGRTLTADEMRDRATPDMVRGWLESGEKKYVSVLEERLNHKYAEARYSPEDRRLWERHVIRSKPVGFWESMITNALGEERNAYVALPFLSTGAEAAGYYDLLSAANADADNEATPEQVRLLEDFADWQARERSKGWSTFGNIVGEAPAMLAEYATGGRLIFHLGKAGVKKAGQKSILAALTKYTGLQAGYRVMQASKVAAATKLGRIAAGSKNAAVIGAGQLVTQTLAGEALGGSRVRSSVNAELLARNFDIATDDALQLYTKAVDDQGVLDVLPQALVDNYIEMFSESMGPALKELVPAMNLSAFRKLAANKGIVAARETLEKGGFNGIIEELGEEFLGGVLRAGAAEIDPETFEGLEGSLDQFTDWREVLGMAAGFAGISGAARGAGLVGERLFQEKGAPVEGGVPDKESRAQRIRSTIGELEDRDGGVTTIDIDGESKTVGEWRAELERLEAEPAAEDEAGEIEDSIGAGLERPSETLGREAVEGVALEIARSSLNRLEAEEGAEPAELRVRTPESLEPEQQEIVDRGAEAGIDVVFMDGMPANVPGSFDRTAPGVVVLNADSAAYAASLWPGLSPEMRPWFSLAAVYTHESTHDFTNRLDDAGLQKLVQAMRSVSPERFDRALETYNAMRESAGLGPLDLESQEGRDESVAFLSQQLVPYLSEIQETGDARVLQTMLESAPKNLIERILDALIALANKIPGLNIDTRGLARVRKALKSRGATAEAKVAQEDIKARAAWATILSEAFAAAPARAPARQPEVQGPSQLQGPPTAPEVEAGPEPESPPSPRGQRARRGKAVKRVKESERKIAKAEVDVYTEPDLVMGVPRGPAADRLHRALQELHKWQDYKVTGRTDNQLRKNAEKKQRNISKAEADVQKARALFEQAFPENERAAQWEAAQGRARLGSRQTPRRVAIGNVVEVEGRRGRIMDVSGDLPPLRAPADLFPRTQRAIIEWEDGSEAVVPTAEIDRVIEQGRRTPEEQAAHSRYAKEQRDKWLPYEAQGGESLFALAPPVDSPEFRAWFGDSKVVGEDGEPIVMYHGTVETDERGEAFTEFLDNQYFVSDPAIADRYATGNVYGRADARARIYPTYVSIKNPLVLENVSGAAMRRALEQPENAEHDGAMMVVEGEWLAVPRSSQQVKSAIGNQGTFDPQNPDIRFALNPPVARVDTRNGSSTLIPLEGGRVIRPSQFSIPLGEKDRRTGVGTQLFQDVVRHTRKNFPDAQLFRVYAPSEGVVSFWEAQGFRVTDAKRGPLGSTVMERPIRKEADPRFALAPPVNSPEFRRWFGDSKVVGDDGQPLRLYRGIVEKGGYTPSPSLEAGVGIFLTDSPDVAGIFTYPREYGESITEEYDEEADEYVPLEGGEVQELYARIVNPLELSGSRAQDFVFDTALQSRILGRARANGHDGVILRDVEEGVGDWMERGTTYVVFEPTQIKSATENVGTYDPQDPDIRRALGWHGTGSQFDKFDTGFIGTGEGAQAYGWGLYFSGLKKVAEWYRAKRADPRIVFVHKSGRRFDGTTPPGSKKRAKKKASRRGGAAPAAMSGPPSAREIESHAYESLQGMGDGFREADYRPTPKRVREMAREAAKYERSVAASQTPYRERAVHLGAAKILEDIGSVDGGDYKLELKGGAVLQVDLAPKEEDYLLWDRPLSEQSEKVHGILGALGFTEEAPLEWEALPADPAGTRRWRAKSSLGLIEIVNVSGAPGVFGMTIGGRMEAPHAGRGFFRSLKDAKARAVMATLPAEGRGSDIYHAMIGRYSGSEVERAKQASQALLSAGIRGIKYLDGTSRAAGEGSYNYVIFDAEDVDITGRFALAPTGLSTSIEEHLGADSRTRLRWDELAENLTAKMADRLVALKKLQDEIAEAAGPLPDDLSPYDRAMLMAGRIEARVLEIARQYHKPTMDIVRRLGISLKDFGNYLYARHAEERNKTFVKWQVQYEADKARIDELRGQPEEEVAEELAELRRRVRNWEKRAQGKTFDTEDNAASGMSNAKAAEIIKAAEKRYDKSSLQEAADLFDSMNRETLALRRDSGLISEAEYAEFTERWGHYAPLRSDLDTDNDYRSPSSKSFQVRGYETEMARGRSTQADNPYVWGVQAAYQAVERAERNRVAEAFMQMLEAHPEISPARYFIEERGAEDTSEIAKDTFTFKRGGKEFQVKIDEKLARAMKALDYASIPKAMQFLRPVMTWLRRAATSWNPDFILPNFARDLTQGLIVLSKEERAGLRRDVLGKTMSMKPQRAMLDALAVQDGRLDIETLSGERKAWAQRAIDFMNAGGKSAWHFTKSFKDMQEDMLAELEDPSGAVRVTAARLQSWLKKLDRLNDAVENGVRLSTFVALRDRGYSEQQAANAAKNLTVNFNRQGEWGPVFNSLYMFFNAGMGGLLTMKRAMMDGPPSARKRVGQVLAGLVSLGAAQELYNRLLGGDDEETGKPNIDNVPEWKQDTNLVLLGPDGTQFTIPLPYGFNVFHRLGRAMVRTAFFDKGVVEEALDTLAVGAESANPIGSSPTLLHAVSPTVLDPAVDIVTNINFAGTPVHPDRPGFGPQPVQSAESFGRTHAAFKSIAEGLNSITGGDHYEPGLIDVYPDTLEHLFEFAVGGTGRTIERALNSAEKVLLGKHDELSWDDAPVVRRFIGSAPEWMLRSDYYDAISSIEMQSERLDYYRKQGDRDYVRELLREQRSVIALKGQAKASRKRVAALRKRLVAAQKSENKKQEKAIERLLEQEYRRLLQPYFRAATKDRK